MESRKPDKENGSVLYYDKEHVYVDRETQANYISVTTLIHKYTHEFDSQFWSAYKALEALLDAETFAIIKKTLLGTKKFNPIILNKLGIDEQEFYDKRAEILASYEEERNKSCERGTRIHAEFENKFYTKKEHNLSKYGLQGNFICEPNYYELDLERGVYPEYLIYRKSADGILRVAGQIDLLIKDGNDIYIWDYKTNKKLDKTSYYNRNKRKYECLKAPLGHIMDCNYMVYTLQLSLYAYLLQQINPDFNIKELKLIHVDHDGKVTEHVLEYLKDDVERMLKHYKRQIKVQAELARDIPPTY